MISIPSIKHRSWAWALLPVAAAAASVALLSGQFAPAEASPRPQSARPTIVLVHGDWADGSSWNAVTSRLIRRGYHVIVPPNPLRGPTEDSASLRSFLLTIQGPVVLAAHSYGGFVVTNAAVGLTNVKALVYVDAFIPDEGDTLLGLVPDSCLATDPAKVFGAVPDAGGAANGVDPESTTLMAATQRPAFTNQVVEQSGPPAWKTIPSWSLIGTEDHVVPLDRQEFMSTRAHAAIEEVNAGHLSLISRPEAVTKVIEDAVAATS
jgi:pimeloyl-ACP methyl ester carboxylesterase